MNNLEKELLRTLNEANEFMFDKGDWIKSFGIDSVLPSLAKYFARVAILKHAVDMDETESYSAQLSPDISCRPCPVFRFPLSSSDSPNIGEGRRCPRRIPNFFSRCPF